MVEETTQSLSEEIKLYIPLESYQKLMAYVDLVTTEITGFADVNYDEEKKSLLVGNVYLVKQKAHATEVEMDEESVDAFNLDLISQGITQLPRLWWHSHVDMSVFFSGTDENTIENLKNDSFMVSLVVNKKREMFATLTFWKPFPHRVNSLPIVILKEEWTIPEELKTEVKEKVEVEDWKKKWEKPSGRSFLAPAKRTIKTLPKDSDRFLEIVTKYNLEEVWDSEFKEFLYEDKLRTEIWRDPWRDGRFKQGEIIE